MLRSITRLSLAAALLFVAGAAYAIPKLQVYIPGATYDPVSEGWVTSESSFDLWVIGANVDIYDVRVAFGVPTNEDGSIKINGTTYDETPGTSYADYLDAMKTNPADPTTYFVDNGTPVMGDYDGTNLSATQLPLGGMFPTSFYQYFVGDFGTTQTVQNYIPGPEFGDTASGELKVFAIEILGYSQAAIVAYDHYIKQNGEAQYKVTPYSHNAGTDGVIPEPATLSLFGTGLLALSVAIRRKGGKA